LLLMEYADKLSIKNILRKYMEILLWRIHNSVNYSPLKCFAFWSGRLLGQHSK
jgi:hypothetical protein